MGTLSGILLAIIAGLHWLSDLVTPLFRPYWPMHYRYSLELTVEANGARSAVATYNCTFAGLVEQEGISYLANPLIYEGHGDALALRLDDGRVILVDFFRGRGFCKLDDGGRFWGWLGIEDESSWKDARRGYIDKESFEEARGIVDEAYDEQKAVDLLATKKVTPLTLWVLDNGSDPTTLRLIDWREPEVALGNDVRLKSLVIRPSRRKAESDLAKDLPWAKGEKFRNRWLTWFIYGEPVQFPLDGDYPALPGTMMGEEPRFRDVSVAFSKRVGESSMTFLPRIDAWENKVSIRPGPAKTDNIRSNRDYVRLDKLELGEGNRGHGEWRLWNPEFCVADNACFELRTETYGDGYAFSWRGRFRAIGRGGGRGSRFYVLDSKTDTVYSLRLGSIGGRIPYITTR